MTKVMGAEKRQTVMYVTQHNSLVSDNQSLITACYRPFMLSWINDEDPHISISSSRTGLLRDLQNSRDYVCLIGQSDWQKFSWHLNKGFESFLSPKYE